MTILPFPPILSKKALPAAQCAWDGTTVQTQFPGNTDIQNLNGVPFVRFFGGDPGSSSVLATTAKSPGGGKYYFEVKVSPALVSVIFSGVGISQASNPTLPLHFGGSGFGIQFGSDGTAKDADTFGSVSGYNPALSNNIGTFMVAYDSVNLLAYGGVNGVWGGGSNPATGVGGLSVISANYRPCVIVAGASVPNAGAFADAAFSTGTWQYLPPVGFSQWR